jgi:outer membrane protein OmpA-like peptidoglycan-associated protein
MHSDNGHGLWPAITEEITMAGRTKTRRLVALSVIAALAAGSASAETQTSKQEAAGVGVGATIGAVAGGPVGLIVGAAAGAWLGDRFHQKNEQVNALSGSLDEAEIQVGSLGRTVQKLQSDRKVADIELSRLRSMARPELLSLLQTGIEMDLLFRTDEHVLADSTGSRLRQLATTLATMPDIRIQLDGFADERGDAAYNQKLSIRRADHVREVLVGAGVTPTRIKIAAHGESPAIDTNADSYALDRRVRLTLYVDDSPSFAANPN